MINSTTAGSRARWSLCRLPPRLDGCWFGRYGNRVIEPEIKGALAALLLICRAMHPAASTGTDRTEAADKGDGGLMSVDVNSCREP